MDWALDRDQIHNKASKKSQKKISADFSFSDDDAFEKEEEGDAVKWW